MKTLLYLNYFAVGLPIALTLLCLIDGELLMFSLLSTMITGALQVMVALALLFVNYRNVHLYIYFTITVIFFILWLGFNIEYWLYTLPPVLAIYLTYIVISEYKKSLL
jgi:hypothetical protein